VNSANIINALKQREHELNAQIEHLTVEWKQVREALTALDAQVSPKKTFKKGGRPRKIRPKVEPKVEEGTNGPTRYMSPQKRAAFKRKMRKAMQEYWATMPAAKRRKEVERRMNGG
jgi:hypothetical protein